MSIAEQAARITSLRDELRAVLMEMGLAEEGYKLEQCVGAVADIPKIPVSNTILDTVNTQKAIEAGYHSPGGTVSIATEEKTATQNGRVTPSEGKVLSAVVVDVDTQPVLQEKTAQPSKEIQEITADDGFDGLSKVIIQAIADIYADVSGVSALAEDVLEGKTFVAQNGESVGGTMKNMADSEILIDGLVSENMPIPAGFYNGLGFAKITSTIENELAGI